MRVGQYLIRFIVFSCIVLEPSDSGIGTAIGVAAGALIGVVIAAINRFEGNKHNHDDVDE